MQKILPKIINNCGGMTNSEKFAKLNGIQWHEPNKRMIDECIACGLSCKVCRDQNPTFTDAKSILEIMMKRKDFYLFLRRLSDIHFGYTNNINIDYIINPDKLLDASIEWCEEKINEIYHQNENI